MTGGVHVRTAAAVRTAVLWVSLCMLLQHLGHHPQFTAEAQGSVHFNILRYFTLPNSKFAASFPAGRVDFSNSVEACRTSGGSLVSGQSAAAQNAITVQLKGALPMGQSLSHTYMGGDAMYSVNWEKDPTKQCTRGIQGASLKCIYQWNIGLFTSESVDGQGVSFYRGSLYSVPGAGPVNGYTPFWPSNYPAHGQTFMISRYVSGSGVSSTWYDGYGLASSNAETPAGSYLIVCEVQDSAAVNTTTLPPREAQPSWIQSHWYVPTIIALVVLAAIIGLIILCCCLGGRDEEKYLYPMVIREASDTPLRAREITDNDDDYYNDNDRDVSMVPSQPMAMGNIESANVSVYSGAENDINDDGDVYSEGNR
ncbi:uncharacterized protein TM35_000401420 [Trypanosoma theileri]|uniref:Membrane-associated protein n=1 Tax=Trypanosoma theileri TaxID=67003 RepID=A0A1X0NJF7_9TRYP|nr:uncharacterized protein TM35_000401420 [Trypanosoma theileri]ORC84875.1 hypothetical protein TM35_000401420 [Trypanosoma theileri]